MNNCLSSRELVLDLELRACFLMYARLIWMLPAAWGLYYSCLDKELSLKALEESQALGEMVEHFNVQLRGESIIKKERKEETERKKEK